MPTQRNRFFSSIQNTDKNHGSFSYVWSDAAVITGTANPITGAWIPVSADAAGFINVNAGLQITGSINASISAAVAVTGNPLMTVSNPVLAATGAIQGGNTLPVYVTGTINTIVTGQVSSNVSIAAIAVTGNPGVTVTGWNTGISVNVFAPAGFIGIDTGVRAVNVVAGALTVSSVAVTGGTSGSALGSLDLRNSYLPVSGVGTFGVTVSNTVNANITNTAPLNVTGIINTVVTGQVSSNVSISAIAVTGNPGFTVTGFNTGITINVSAPLGLIGIDTGVRAVNIINPVLAVTGALSASISSVAVTGFASNISPLAISGIVQATLSAAPVVDAIASGNALLVTANRLSSGISGLLASNLSDAAWVTGQVSLTNTGPIAISGVVTTAPAVLQAVSGNATIINTAPIAVSGVVVTTAAALQAISGNVNATITGFNTGIFVYTQPVTRTVVSNSTPSGAAQWTSMTDMRTGLLGANPNRTLFFIQNIHTGIPLMVALNSSPASVSNFNYILNPSLNLGFGGSSFSDDHYRGPVQISGGAYIAWEV